MTTANAGSQPPAVDLTDIQAPPAPQGTADPKVLAEEKTYEQAKQEVELNALRQDIGERKDYAKRIFVLICFWLGGMFALLLVQGFSAPRLFSLSDPVLLAAIGGTTVNVLGIFGVVVNYLFPKRA